MSRDNAHKSKYEVTTPHKGKNIAHNDGTKAGRQDNLCPCRFSGPDRKKAPSILREFIADALLSRLLDERPSEAPSMRNYLVILSSRGLQS